jgi:hypothetical protein
MPQSAAAVRFRRGPWYSLMFGASALFFFCIAFWYQMSSGTPSRIPRPPARSSPLPSPPSLEIAAVLAQAGPFDDLKSLVPSVSFTRNSEDHESDWEDVPPFPKDHQPPIFIIQGHRAQVPFAVRSGVIALGDIHPDERTARIILSAPTIPRMNLVMKEQLFMNTWVVSYRFFMVCHFS